MPALRRFSRVPVMSWGLHKLYTETDRRSAEEEFASLFGVTRFMNKFFVEFAERRGGRTNAEFSGKYVHSGCTGPTDQA